MEFKEGVHWEAEGSIGKVEHWEGEHYWGAEGGACVGGGGGEHTEGEAEEEYLVLPWLSTWLYLDSILTLPGSTLTLHVPGSTLSLYTLALPGSTLALP